MFEHRHWIVRFGVPKGLSVEFNGFVENLSTISLPPDSTFVSLFIILGLQIGNPTLPSVESDSLEASVNPVVKLTTAPTESKDDGS